MIKMIQMLCPKKCGGCHHGHIECTALDMKTKLKCWNCGHEWKVDYPEINDFIKIELQKTTSKDIDVVLNKYIDKVSNNYLFSEGEEQVCDVCELVKKIDDEWIFVQVVSGIVSSCLRKIIGESLNLNPCNIKFVGWGDTYYYSKDDCIINPETNVVNLEYSYGDILNEKVSLNDFILSSCERIIKKINDEISEEDQLLVITPNAIIANDIKDVKKIKDVLDTSQMSIDWKFYNIY